MQAAVFRGPGTGLVVEERATPVPGPREAVVKVHRAGICGTDLALTDGTGFLQASAGAVLGHEYSGEVVDVGSAVTRLSVGDRITALAAIPACGECPNCLAGELQWCTGDGKLFPASGAYAQFAPVPEPQAVKIPPGLSLADAALVEPFAVALHGWILGEVPADANVLVLGAGPIALAVVYWARRMGAGRIAVQATSRRREKYCARDGSRRIRRRR